jgi:carbon starvation protein
LGGYFLFFALGGGAIGVVLGGNQIEYPAFRGFVSPDNGQALFPMLFIIIACGACSGFHAIIASGTTSKQLRTEPDARLVGYGTMLLEAMVAVVSLCCVMMLPLDAPVLKNGAKPNFLYTQGIGNFLGVLGIPAEFGVAFGLMAFTTFVYDTLDVCTRLGRYILQELTGWHGRFGRWSATALTAGAPLGFLMWQPTDANGKLKPLWSVFWEIFGASNQLLAAMTLVGVTVWLWNTYRARWVWFVTGIPTIWMYSMSMWALVRIINANLGKWSVTPVPWVAVVLVSLGGLMLVEAILVLARNIPRGPSRVEMAVAPT